MTQFSTTDLEERRSEGRLEPVREPSGAKEPGPLARKSRRALLALGGLLMGGRAVHASGSPVRSATAEARLKLTTTALEAVRTNLGRGRFNPGERDPIVIWSRRRMEARLDLSTSRAERIAAAQENLDEMKAMELVVARMHEAGEIDRLALLDSQYRRLEAETWLEQQRAKSS